MLYGLRRRNCCRRSRNHSGVGARTRGKVAKTVVQCRTARLMERDECYNDFPVSQGDCALLVRGNKHFWFPRRDDFFFSYLVLVLLRHLGSP